MSERNKLSNNGDEYLYDKKEALEKYTLAKVCKACGQKTEADSKYCSNCGKPVFEDSEDLNNQYSMRWHDFQMVVMILGGVLAIANGLNQLMGSVYMGQGITADRIYSYYPGMKSCDTFYGIVLIALGVYEFIVRSRLNKFQTNGPNSLKVLYILSIVGGLIYLLWTSSSTGINMLNSSSLGSIGSSILFLIINSIYYSKRSSLFVN